MPRNKLQNKNAKSRPRRDDSKAIAQMNSNSVVTAVDAVPLRVPRAAHITFAQIEDAGTIATIGPSVEVDGAILFRLADLDGSTSYGALFDQYRIRQVSVSFFPLFSETVMTTTGNVNVGQLLTALDFDDATAVTASALRQKESVMETPAYAPQTRTLSPRVAMAAYSGTFTSFANMPAPWIDISSSGVQHYSVKYALENCSLAAGVAVYKIAIRFVLEFRQVQ